MLPHRTLTERPEPAGYAPANVLERICVRPPYYALLEPRLEGLVFTASACAEAPAYLEVGPMTAADLGRHAAIAGLSHVALNQDDDARRYYLAQRAECAFVPSRAPYGTLVRLRSEVSERSKRACRVRVEATVDEAPLATFDLGYTILTASAFGRLFRNRAKPTPPRPSPYGRLLSTAFERGADHAEATVDPLPIDACVGHFDDYPALPVAVLMGQLSYLAGRLVAEEPARYRVERGSIDATDLAWAGELARFRVERAGVDDGLQRFACTVHADERLVGTMTLWLRLVGEADAFA